MSIQPQNALRKWREAQGLSVVAAAAMVPVARQTWHSWERFATVPPQRFMLRLAEISGGVLQPNHFYILPNTQTRQAA